MSIPGRKGTAQRELDAHRRREFQLPAVLTWIGLNTARSLPQTDLAVNKKPLDVTTALAAPHVTVEN